MNEDAIDRLLERLTATSADPLFGVLDGARAPDVHDLAVGAGPSRCLFSGDLGRDLVRAAPHLVQIEPRAVATRRLLGTGWGDSWGVFLTSPASLEQLRRHLRRYLRVRGPGGKTVYFRFYDPRVLRAFLPSCDDGEREAFFGPVTTFATESVDGRELLVFRRGQRDVVPLA